MRRYEISLRLKTEKRNFISPSSHVSCCVLHIKCNLLRRFKQFFEDFRRFPRISENYANIVQELQICMNFSDHFPSVSEDSRRYPKLAEEDPKIF